MLAVFSLLLLFFCCMFVTDLAVSLMEINVWSPLAPKKTKKNLLFHEPKPRGAKGTVPFSFLKTSKKPTPHFKERIKVVSRN
jgi:hypothetical protein